MTEVFVTGKQTLQEGLVTVQSVVNFQWKSCCRMAWNHSTLASSNLRHVVLN